MATTPGNPHNLTQQEQYVVPLDNTKSPFAPAIVTRESAHTMQPLYFGKTVLSGSAHFVVYAHSQTASGLVSLAAFTSNPIL